MIKVAIIIPAHNEEKRIGKTLENYFLYFKNLKKNKILDFKIIVVLNACKDNTLEVVEKYKCRELKILDFEQGGKGFAITQGFKEALQKDWELIGFIDADMATPPNAFYGLIRNIKNSQGIIADRWDKRSKVDPQTFFRRILSRGFNLIVRSLFFIPHRDTQCGAKLFRKDLLKRILPKLGSSEWSFDVDLLFYARRERAKIKSIPTMWDDQKGSKVNWKKTPITMFLSIIRLRLVHSPFKFIIKAYRALPKKLQITYLIEKSIRK